MHNGWIGKVAGFVLSELKSHVITSLTQFRSERNEEPAMPRL